MTEQPAPPPPGGYPAPPSNNLVWAIVVTVLCCLPFGIVAIVKSTQVSGLWAQGRYAEAQQAAEDSKKFAMWGVIAAAVLVMISVVLTFTVGFPGMSPY